MSLPASTKLVLATTNTHKIVELKAILTPVLPGLSNVLSGVEGLDIAEPVENGHTFAQNAAIKAQYYAKATGLPALADDSGLIVDVMGGAPGIFSARWCGHHGDDEANLRLLLQQLADIPREHRAARFVCVAALATPEKLITQSIGQMRGHLRTEPAGNGGFGYDPIFQATEQSVTNAELTAEQKNAISHRRQAFLGMIDAIARVIQ